MDLIKKLNKYIKLIISLSIVDFKDQFSGSYLGLIWSILRPLIFIGAVWLIFSFGMKRNLIDDKYPFILYLLTGYSVWILFSTALTGIMNSFTSNRHLVKRTGFKIIILPLVKILSAFYLHLIFLVIVVLIMFILGFKPTIYWLQLPYYIFMLFIFVFGLGLIVATLRVFTNDIPQLVASILQVGFWVTPIFWSVKFVPQKYLWILNLNPIIYIVNGYRNSFLNQKWFWEDTSFLFSFLLYTIIFLYTGIFVYKKLRAHFGDVI